jgi:L-threonylcarbamoyladenylate synthase
VPRTVRARTPAEAARAAIEAAATWRAGGLVAFPTETVYGLGAAARDPQAVAAVFRAKGRPADHPLIVHLGDAEQLSAWASVVPDAAWRLASAFWPGPLTMVLPRHEDVPAVVTGGQPTVAVRVPSHPVAVALLKAYGDGVAAPSANRFGHLSPTRAEHVIAELAHAPGGDRLLVVDGGPCEVGIESTIVDLSGGRPLVRRLGAVTPEALAHELGVPVDVVAGSAAAKSRPREATAAVRVPGALARHYAPQTPARAVAVGAGDQAPDDVAVLARRPAPAGRLGPWAVLPDAPDDAAHVLYARLRALDAAGAREVWVEDVPPDAGWRAIADRLARATHPERDPEEGP